MSAPTTFTRRCADAIRAHGGMEVLRFWDYIVSLGERCDICGRRLNIWGVPASRDCGGDCAACVGRDEENMMIAMGATPLTDEERELVVDDDLGWF